jgi:hypothetical protein
MLERMLGPTFAQLLTVKGRLVTAGKVALSPWIWISLQGRSPQPYFCLSYMFAPDGHAAFLSLGVENALTPWEDDIARLREHAQRIRDAVPSPAGALPEIGDLSGPQDSRRARANAAGNAYAFRYEREGLPNADQLWEDLYRMVELLKAVDATGLRLGHEGNAWWATAHHRIEVGVVPNESGRDSLVDRRIRAGSREVLTAFLAAARPWALAAARPWAPGGSGSRCVFAHSKASSIMANHSPASYKPLLRGSSGCSFTHVFIAARALAICVCAGAERIMEATVSIFTMASLLPALRLPKPYQFAHAEWVSHVGPF